jgi:hypothetical protein
MKLGSPVEERQLVLCVDAEMSMGGERRLLAAGGGEPPLRSNYGRAAWEGRDGR